MGLGVTEGIAAVVGADHVARCSSRTRRCLALMIERHQDRRGDDERDRAGDDANGGQLFGPGEPCPDAIGCSQWPVGWVSFTSCETE